MIPRAFATAGVAVHAARLVFPAVVAFAVIACPVRAQTVQGRVVEDGTGTAVFGADVEILSLEGQPVGSTTTDVTGGFLLRVPDGAAFSLRVRHIAYRSFTSDPIDRPGADLHVEIRLGVDAIALDPLTVTAPRGAEERHLADFEARRTSAIGGTFLTRREIEARPVATASQLVLGTPGVEVVEVGVRGTNLIYMRHYRGECLANVYVDGVRLVQNEARTVDDFLFMTSNIAAIEVYPRSLTAPLQFQADPDCGAVLYWTARDSGGSWSLKRILTGAGVVAGLIVGGLLAIG